MLELKDIRKNYKAGDYTIEALRGVSLTFPKAQFAAVLGPSGCGKTTLLNLIGGLDRYSGGELAVNGLSTKKFRESDWDTYRNRRVGFVFQTYNLIPHISVLANVELALTLSGVSPGERRRRAKEALEKVGLGDQIYKMPNQVSGGQMQRVAIARSLINDPEILLADEPTGALDSETGTQVMEILKEVAKDRLVIMVTHNEELAGRYSSRIIKLKDGEVISDTGASEKDINATLNQVQGRLQQQKHIQKKPHLSLKTAFSLSIRNLLTKKARTFLTAFAGSIGIIGIALILGISTGMQNYVNRVEEEALFGFPITIERMTMDMSAMFAIMGEMGDEEGRWRAPDDRVHSNNMMGRIINAAMREIQHNDMVSFKAFIESEESGIPALVNEIRYSYTTPLTIFSGNTEDGVFQVNPSTLFELMDVTQLMPPGMADMGGMDMPMLGGGMPGMGIEVWTELTSNRYLLENSFEVTAGRLPENWDEVLLITDRRNRVIDFALFTLGLMDAEAFSDVMTLMAQGREVELEQVSFSFDELLAHTFRLVLNTDFFERTGDVWVDRSDSEAFMRNVVENAPEIRIVGIAAPREFVMGLSSPATAIGYLPDLMVHLINSVNEAEIVREQLANPNINVFTGREFGGEEQRGGLFGMGDLGPAEMMQQMMAFMTMSEEEMFMTIMQNLPRPGATFQSNLALLGVSDINDPSMISIVPRDFAAKEAITEIIADYNARMEAAGREESVIRYTDLVGILLSSVAEIISGVSYVLIAFVSVSLVVSSIMIGVITYISVLERTKEIGILRSIGGSKRDISRVFNAETVTLGFVAGCIGIGVTLLLQIPANAMIEHFAGISNVADLPAGGAVALIIISVVLTLVAGLIPARIAANKDPVVALRTE